MQLANHQRPILPDQKWSEWIRSSSDEQYVEDDSKRWSPILATLGWIFFVLRRISPLEHIKHLVPGLHPHSHTPAKFTDSYLLVTWTLLVAASIFLAKPTYCPCLRVIAVAWALQILQGSLYHNIWRRLIFQAGHPMAGTFNPIRTLALGICSFAIMCWLFGLAFCWSGAGAFNIKIQTVFDAIYFSFVTGSTVGYGDIRPEIGRGGVQAIVVIQIISSICMIAVIIAQAVNAVGTLEMLPRDATSPSSPPLAQPTAQTSE